MTPHPQEPSASWLRRIARFIFDDETMMRVVDPTLADLDHEVQEAGGDLAARRSARLRGYLAFCKLVVLSPFLFADWPGRSQLAQSLRLVGGIVVLLVVTFGAQAQWMTLLLAQLVPRIQEPVIAIAGLGPYVWLLIPAAVMLLAALGRRSPFRVAPTSVIMICGATTTAAAAFGGAGFIAVFARIGRSGFGGFPEVVTAMDALAIPTLLALFVTAATMIVVVVSQWRALRVVSANQEPAACLSGAVVLVLIASLAVSLIAVNQWMLFNEELLEVGLDMSNPARTAGVGGRALVGRVGVATPLAILGFIIALTTLATAFAAWRSSLSRRPNHLLEWSTRLAIVVMLAGCVWHASVIGGQWWTFTTEANALLSR